MWHGILFVSFTFWLKIQNLQRAIFQCRGHIASGFQIRPQTWNMAVSRHPFASVVRIGLAQCSAFVGKKWRDGAILNDCFNLHVLIQPSQRTQGCANGQRKCDNSSVKALNNITYRFIWLNVSSYRILYDQKRRGKSLMSRRVPSPQNSNSTAKAMSREQPNPLV